MGLLVIIFWANFGVSKAQYSAMITELASGTCIAMEAGSPHASVARCWCLVDDDTIFEGCHEHPKIHATFGGMFHWIPAYSDFKTLVDPGFFMTF